MSRYSTTRDAFVDELCKIAESRSKRQDRVDKAVEHAVPVLTGLSVGKTVSDLSFSHAGVSPRRRTIGALIGAGGGFAYLRHKKDKKNRKKAATLVKTAGPFTFKGVATKRFLSKPGSTIKDLSPKIGRIGSLPT